MVKKLSNVDKQAMLDDRLQEEVNKERLNILDDFRATPEEERSDHDRIIKDLKEKRLLTAIDHNDGKVFSRGFKKRWWRFDREADAKVPFIPRWAYFRWSGTGQVLALGATVSVGPSWGAFVLNLPMIEFTLGYVPSPYTL